MTITDKPADEPRERQSKAAETLQPVLAGWLRSRQEFIDTAGGALHRAAHKGLHLGVRLPLYAGQLARFSPRGAWRVGRAVVDLVGDGESRPLRIDSVTKADSATWLKLRKERNDRAHRRLVVMGTLAAPLLFAVAALISPAVLGGAVGLGLWIIVLKLAKNPWIELASIVLPIIGWLVGPAVIPEPPTLPWWPSFLAGLAIVMGLGYIGRPLGKPLAKPATLTSGAPGPLKAPFVTAALCKLGIGGLTKPESIGLLFDVARVGPGYQCDVELPAGVTASSVMERRDKLSAALRRELGTVWPSVGKRHEGHLSLYVSDQPMVTAKQAPWPLLKDGTADLFKPVPMFTNQRGTWVDVTFAYSNAVVGAVPRQGKTFILRQALLVAGLDPRARVYLFDGKGTGDLAPCALFAHFYGVGDEPEDIDRQLNALREVRAELRRRAKVIRKLGEEHRELCPESKVTSKLASRKDLGLEPIVIGIDETQIFFEYEDQKIADEFVAIVTDLVKRGPALGIIVLLATQNVTAKTIPTPISTNAVIRLCLKVFGFQANDQVLGTGARKSGVDATIFAPQEKGIGYLRADGADAAIVRSVHGLDAVAAEKVAMRARQARLAAGRLTGAAAGATMAEEADQAALVDDVRQVFASLANPGALHLADLVTGLAALRQGIYGHLDNTALASMLRFAGVRVATVHAPGKPREEASAKGTKVEWLDVSTTAAIGPEEEAEAAEKLTEDGES